MIKWKAAQRQRGPRLIETSPLRRADPRARLALSLCISLAVMLPPQRMLTFAAIYAVFLLWARLLPETVYQIWRLRWVLIMLWILDVIFVDITLAAVITLRLILLSGVLTLFTCTTTPVELQLALERLHVPYRYAFSLSLAFQSIHLLEEEWRLIREAQQARGALPRGQLGLRSVITNLQRWVALTTPAIVLATRRAWAMTEAAYARGLDSPGRRPYRQLAMRRTDWALMAGALIVCVVLFRV